MPVSDALAVVVTAPGGREMLSLEAVEVAPPGPGQVQVEVIASGLNFIEVYQRKGIYPIPTPFVLGGEGAGTVVALGAGVEGIAVGEVVAWATAPGSHATRLNVPADQAVPVPVGVDPALAAAVMLQGMTAHYLTRSTYPLGSGDAALVHAAAGGTGQLIVQLAKNAGARVIGVTSTPQKAAKATAAGAELVLESALTVDPAAFAAQVRGTLGGSGVHVVYDGVGRTSFDASLASLRRRGTLVLFGAASGPVETVDPQRLNSGGSLFLTRPTLFDYIATREELLWRSGDLFTALAQGTLQVEIGASYPLAQAREAYEALEGRGTTGKVILTR